MQEAEMRKMFSFFVLIFMIILLTSPIRAWMPSQRLTWTAGDSSCLDVTIDSSNNILMVFQDDSWNYPTVDIFFKKSTDGGVTWPGIKRLTWSSGDSLLPQIATNSSNHILVVWQDNTSGYFEIYFMKSTDGGTTWLPRKRLSWNSGYSMSPAIAVATNGKIYVAWCDNFKGNEEIYLKSSTDGGNSWSAINQLTWNPLSSTSPDIAVDTNNNVHVVWANMLVDTLTWGREIFHKKSTDGSVSWSTTKKVTYDPYDEYENVNPKLVIHGTKLHLLWKKTWFRIAWGHGEWVKYTNSPDGGASWSWHKILDSYTYYETSSPGSSHANYDGAFGYSTNLWDLAVDSSGNPHAVWNILRTSTDPYQIFYRYSPSGGTPWNYIKKMTNTSGDSRGPVIAVDSSGTAHILWQDDTPGNYEIYYKKE